MSQFHIFAVVLSVFGEKMLFCFVLDLFTLFDIKQEYLFKKDVRKDIQRD